MEDFLLTLVYFLMARNTAVSKVFVFGDILFYDDPKEEDKYFVYIQKDVLARIYFSHELSRIAFTEVLPLSSADIETKKAAIHGVEMLVMKPRFEKLKMCKMVGKVINTRVLNILRKFKLNDDNKMNKNKTSYNPTFNKNCYNFHRCDKSKKNESKENKEEEEDIYHYLGEYIVDAKDELQIDELKAGDPLVFFKFDRLKVPSVAAAQDIIHSSMKTWPTQWFGDSAEKKARFEKDLCEDLEKLWPLSRTGFRIALWLS